MPLTVATDADPLTNAYTLAHLASAAYADAPSDDSSFGKTVFTSARTFGRGDAQGFVCGNETHVVLAFRGTDEITDWITNLNIVMEPGFGGQVHRGFAEALEAVWDDVDSLVGRVRDNGQTLWVTGHSLGGALATLAAKRLTTKPFATVTFGQPRVGDQRFARAYRPELQRFVNNKDVVPTVPLRLVPGAWPPAFYTHVGTLDFFDSRGKLTKKRGELGLMPDLMDALGPLASREAEARALLIDGLRDHKIENYIRCLEKNLP